MKPVNAFNQSLVAMMLFGTAHFLIGCSAYKQILPAKGNSEIDKSEVSALVTPNARYKIKLKDGREAAIKVTGLDEENIYGMIRLVENGPYGKAAQSVFRRDDILRVKKLKFSPLGTALAIVIPIAIIGWVIAEDVGEGWSSGPSAVQL